jgi:hypothetical protein
MADHGHFRRIARLAKVIAKAETMVDHVLIDHDSADSRTMEWNWPKGGRRRGVRTAAWVML